MSVIKLIFTLLLVVLVAVLTGFNLSNTCTIWFFHNFENIPIFAALLVAFIFGVVITLPFVFFKKKSREEKKLFNKKKNTDTTDVAPVSQNVPGDVQLDVSDASYPSETETDVKDKTKKAKK